MLLTCACTETFRREGEMAEYLGSLTIKLTEFQETQIPRAKGTPSFWNRVTQSAGFRQLSSTRKASLRGTYFY